jgi:hypothetical protein
MESIILNLRQRSSWPIVGKGFVAWRASTDTVMTIKRNKIGLFIMRANGTLIATTDNEEVIIDWISEKRWEKSGIV